MAEKIIAVPVNGDSVDSHFGHCKTFAFYKTDGDTVVSKEIKPAPAHTPGSIPNWIADEEAAVALLGGVGKMAKDILAERGVQVVSGIASQPADKAVEEYLKGTLNASGEECSHEHDGEHADNCAH